MLKNLSIMLKTMLNIILKLLVVKQCTIIIVYEFCCKHSSNTRNDNNLSFIALVMFEHNYSQQIKHLGMSQMRVLTETGRKLFQQQLKMAEPARPFQLRTADQHGNKLIRKHAVSHQLVRLGVSSYFVKLTSGQAAIPQLVRWPCFQAVSRYSQYIACALTCTLVRVAASLGAALNIREAVATPIIMTAVVKICSQNCVLCSHYARCSNTVIMLNFMLA